MVSETRKAFLRNEITVMFVRFKFMVSRAVQTSQKTWKSLASTGT